MKRIILIAVLMGTFMANAQIALEFESMLDQKIGASPAEKIIAYVDANPVSKGINTSTNAVKVVEFAGCEYWGATIVSEMPQMISLEDGRFFSIDFLSPRSKGMVTLKLRNGIEKDFIYSGKANTWRRAVFNFSDASKSTNSEKIDIFFDVRDYENPKKLSSKNRAEQTYWFDNLRQSRKKIRKR